MTSALAMILWHHNDRSPCEGEDHTEDKSVWCGREVGLLFSGEQTSVLQEPCQLTTRVTNGMTYLLPQVSNFKKADATILSVEDSVYNI